MMKTGVTLFLPNWLQTGGESTWRTHFQKLQQSGIKEIVFVHRHQEIEGADAGSYKVSNMTNIRNCIRVANEYGISVHLNVHTNYLGGMMAAYIGNLRNLFSRYDPEWEKKREGWYNCLEWWINFFKNEPNVLSFQVYNEPVGSDWGINVPANEFNQLFQETYDWCKTVTSKPVTTRYGIACSDNYYGDAVYTIWDYICFNCYLDQPGWAGHTTADLQRFMGKARTYGKRVVVTEYGYKTSDDEAQAQRFRNKLPIFSDEGVDILFGWWYSSGIGPDGDNPDNKDYQLRDRPAYAELIKYNEGGSELAKITNNGTSDLKVTKIITEEVILKPGESIELDGDYVVECQ